jgi:hypothetical protein
LGIQVEYKTMSVVISKKNCIFGLDIVKGGVSNRFFLYENKENT